MLMRQHDARHSREIQTRRLRAPLDLPRAEAGVEQYRAAVSLDRAAVSS